MHRFAAAAAGIALLAAGSTCFAQTIYPIDRAEILAGTTFDFKVEFPGLADPAKVSISVNGEDYTKALGNAASFIAREDGKDQSALILRDYAAGGLQSPRHGRRRLSRDHLERLCHRSAKGQERNPVYRRRHVAGASDRRAPAGQGRCRRQGAGQAGNGRHAAYGVGGDRRQRFDHYRFRKLGQRLRHRPQIGGQCHGRLCRPHARSA